jgi:hypothetical protein
MPNRVVPTAGRRRGAIRSVAPSLNFGKAERFFLFATFFETEKVG